MPRRFRIHGIEIMQFFFYQFCLKNLSKLYVESHINRRTGFQISVLEESYPHYSGVSRWFIWSFWVMIIDLVRNLIWRWNWQQSLLYKRTLDAVETFYTWITYRIRITFFVFWERQLQHSAEIIIGKRICSDWRDPRQRHLSSLSSAVLLHPIAKLSG